MSGSPKDQSKEPSKGLPETFDVKIAAEKLLDEFELSWKRGEPPDLERYMELGGHLGHGYAAELNRIDSEYRTPNVDRDANREILFGLLAAQLQFVPRSAIVDAVRDWLQDQRKSVGEILIKKGVLQLDQRELLDSLTNEQIKKKWGDIVQSIADLSSVTQLLADLQSLKAVELKQSLETIIITRQSVQGAKREGSDATRFKILRPDKPEAKGGIGEVYLARDEELGREVALKQIQPQNANNEEIKSSFVQEAEITGSLEHPSIVPVYGLGYYGDGKPYYAMRFIRGNNLTYAIDRYHDPKRVITAEERSLEFRQLLGRFIDICQAIEYAHSRGVLHRDLKPGNIMLGKYGETLVVDWGLAKIRGRQDKSISTGEVTLVPASGLSSAPTELGSIKGTPQYMSPEQADGRLHELGPATDVYSLGATLYHLLTGKPPVERKAVSKVLADVSAGNWIPVLKLKPNVAPAIAAVCEKAMSRHSKDRYGSAALLAQDVEKWLADEPVSAYPEPLRVRMLRWVRKHQTVVGIGTSLAAALTIGAIVFSLIKAQQARELGKLNSQLNVKNVQLNAKNSELEDANRKETQARNEAELRRRRAEKELEFDLAISAAGEWNESRLRQQFALLKSIRELSEASPTEPKFFEANRVEFENKVEVELRKLTDSLHFDEERQSLFAKLLSTFDSFHLPGADNLVQDLKKRRDDRITEWNVLIGGSGDELELQGPNVNAASAFKQSIEGDFEARVEFAPDWEKSKFVGLTLAAEDGPELAYKFLVLSPGLSERDLADPNMLAKAEPIVTSLTSSPRPLRLVIQRGEETLSAVNAFLSSGPLVLELIRDGSKMRLIVNPNQPKTEDRNLASDDPFAPSRRSSESIHPFLGENQTAHLKWLRTKRVASQPSAVEEGDLLLHKQKQSEARDKYLTAFPALEAKYKVATIDLDRGASELAVGLLKEIVESGESDETSRRWRRFAQIKWLSQMAKAESPDLEEIRILTERIKKEGGAGEALRLLPKRDRDPILQELGKMGLRFRIAFNSDDDLSTLDLKRQLDEWFVEDKSVRVSTGWRIADAYRYAGKFEEAEKELRRILQLAKGSGTVERQLVADLTWFMTADLGTSSNASRVLSPQKASEALELLEPYLIEDKSDQFTTFFPLLGERARIKYLMGQKKDARDDLDRLFSMSKTFPSAILYSEYGQARHLSALMLEEEGKKEEARRERSLTTFKSYYRGEGPPPLGADPSSATSIDATFGLVINGFGIALNGEAERWEVETLVKAHFPGSGISNTLGAGMLRSVLDSKSARYGKYEAPEFIHRLVTEIYNTKRGGPIAREMILKQCGLAEYQRRPTRLILYEAVRLSAFGTPEIPAALEPVAWDKCQQIIDCFNHKLITEEDMPEILNLWTGAYTPKRWNQIKKKLSEGVTGFPAPVGLTESIAYVLAKNYLASGIEKNRPPALELLQLAKESPNSPPAIAAAAKADLEGLSTTPPSAEPKP